ncbi:hypothetical protein ACIBF5_07430 [Micromonospora sp. NPDC050417]|uniref:hypothetical protein n=1 Tax=Micromonospora sp. NPDC050417 TaxID=3364280 RepID=UPI003791E009
MSAETDTGTSGAGTSSEDIRWREVEQQRWEERWAEYSAGYGIEVGEWGADADGRVSFTNMSTVDEDDVSQPSVLVHLHQPDATADGYGWGQVMLSLQQAHHLHQRLGRLIYQATYGGEL